jgi:hypothetical protein
METDDEIALIKIVFKENTPLRLAYYDYLSLHYPLTNTLLSKYRYCWNYLHLCSNSQIDKIFKVILLNFKSAFPESPDYQVEQCMATIDLIFSINDVINNKSFDNLEEISNSIPSEHSLRTGDFRYYNKLIFHIFKDLLDQELLVLSDKEITQLHSVQKDFDKFLPLSEECILNNPNLWDWERLSENENINFSTNFLGHFAEKVNWKLLSGNNAVNWTERLIDKYKDRLDWAIFSRVFPFSDDQQMKYASHISWGDLCYNKKIYWTPKSFLNNYAKELNHQTILWKLSDFDNEFNLLYHSNLVYRINTSLSISHRTPEFISFETQHIISDRHTAMKFIDWMYFCCSPPSNLYESNLWGLNHGLCMNDQVYRSMNGEKSPFRINKNVINWDKLLDLSKLRNIYKSNHNFRIEPLLFAEKHPRYRFHDYEYMQFIDKLNWNQLSTNKDLPWSLDILLIFENRWNWDLISVNPKIPYNLETLRILSKNINWDIISGLESSFWSFKVISEFSDLLNWDKLSSNKSIPWTINLLDRHLTKWNWTHLSENTSLSFSVRLIANFEEYWNWELLSCNESVPWTFEIFQKFLNRWIFATYKEFLRSEEIFLGGLCGNLSFYREYIIPLLDDNVELLLKSCDFPRIIRDKTSYTDIEILSRHYYINEIVPFGKYKGRSLKEIIDLDLQYIIWLLRKQFIFIDHEAMSYLCSILYCYSGIIKFLPQLDILSAQRCFTFEEEALEIYLFKAIHIEEYPDEIDYSDFNIVDDALEGDPENYWNID